ncbi:MAG: hypothetical protein IH585_12000 [Anaerolineaceae bacterium]|nr:hypothetical protein [Anaerolineaceae bacterium]
MTTSSKPVVDISVRRVHYSDPEFIMAANDRWYKSLAIMLRLLDRLEKKEDLQGMSGTDLSELSIYSIS